MNSNLSLNELREQLDDIDANLVALYEKRMEVCGQVALYKQQTGKPVLDATREKEKLTAVRNMVEYAENADAIENLFKQIMADSRQLQKRIIDGETI